MAEPVVETIPFQNADNSKLTITRNGSETIEPKPETPKEEPVNPALEDPANPKAEGATEPPPTTPAGQEPKPADPATPEAPAAPKEEEYTEEQFHQDVDTFIGESTGGAVRSVKDISTIIEENKKLKATVAHKEPDFPSPVAKVVYDLAILAAGAEVSTARQLFHVMSLPLDTMTPKEKQFEAFRLDRPNLSETDARNRFEALYEKSYTDLENDLVQLDAHELATVNAETKLKDKRKALEDAVKQGSKKEPEGPTAEQLQAVETQLTSALESFAGVTLKFDDAQYGKLDIAMDKSKAQAFMEILKNPHKLIDQIADTCRDASGNLDLNGFITEMYLLFDRDRISQEERDHLMKLGKIAQMQEQKNTPKKELQEVTTTQTKPSFKDAMAGAVKAAGLAN